MNGKIYLPTNVSSNNCAYINNNDVIRVFDYRGTNTYITYTDYYVNNHYITNTGTSYVGQNFNYNCINENNFTTDIYYRNDMVQILVYFTILCIFCFYIPLKIFLRFFKRFL